MSLGHPIIQNITTFAQKYVAVNAWAVMFGGGLGYAIQNGFWHHTPLILLNPFAYVTYQAFVSQKQLIRWSKDTLVEILS
jgi:hypothetical protein